ncbi:MAG: hypothetical protein FWD61_05660, partial [Phycisphaerales bacterium]|nr:hypothetical protein [Phycisphaerales bacterium]
AVIHPRPPRPPPPPKPLPSFRHPPRPGGHERGGGGGGGGGGVVEFVRTPYDVQTTVEKVKAIDALDNFLGLRLLDGR